MAQNGPGNSVTAEKARTEEGTAAGLANYNLLALFGFSLAFRGLRYALVGALLYVFGEQAKRFIDRWFGWLCLLGIVLVGLLVWYLASH